MLARVDASAPAAQPLPVEQVRARELGTAPGPAEPLNRLAILQVRIVPVDQQRPTAGLNAEREVGAGRLRRLRQPLERITG